MPSHSTPPPWLVPLVELSGAVGAEVKEGSGWPTPSRTRAPGLQKGELTMGRLVWFGLLALPGPAAVAVLLVGAAAAAGAGFAAGRRSK